jgi:hypothetical protein
MPIVVHTKSEVQDEIFALADYFIFRETIGQRIGFIVEKHRVGFIGFNNGVILTDTEKRELAQWLAANLDVVYQIDPNDELYKMMENIWDSQRQS